MIRNIFSFFVVCLFLVSCDKDNGTFSWTSEARYSVTITGKWASPAFGVPAGAHYTTFAGQVHNGSSPLYKEGSLASPGMESLAEIGNITPLLGEINGNIAGGKASSLLIFVAPDVTGTVSSSIYCNSNYSSLSFASMLAPTPDWFIGVSNLNLYHDFKWIADTTVQLYAYDAGTEDGDIFSSNNAATSPQQTISKLDVSQAKVLANGNSSLGPIATVRFTKQ